jgi:predicted DNA-binding transcriptional regulator AlpA
MSMQAAINRTDPDALLTEVQAADFLCLSIRTLQAWRIKLAGPRFVRAGRAIRYRRSDLIAWIDANTSRSGA